MIVKIFIAYSHEDFFARGIKLRNYLSKHIPDSDVYIDQSKAKGQKWHEINEKKLEESDIALVILTPAALQSHEVLREVKEAQKANKRILPCKDDNLELDWKDLPWGLNELEGIKFEEDEVLRTRAYREVTNIIKDLFGTRTISVAESFEFTLKARIVTGKVPILYNQRSFEMSYLVKKGSLVFQSAKVDEDALSVYMKVNCKEDTELDLILPRELIDSKLDQKDYVFFVLVDGLEIVYSEEESTENDRTLTITLAKGTHGIEIIGTQLLGISFAGGTKPENVVRILSGSGTPHEGKYLDPEILTIKQGEKVKWENFDSAAHTITSGTPEKGPNGIFDSSLFMAGHSFEITLNEKGTFDYHCMVHPWKTGKIIVK